MAAERRYHLAEILAHQRDQRGGRDRPVDPVGVPGEEADAVAERAMGEDVHAAGTRHHGAEFGVGRRAEQGVHGPEEPDADEESSVRECLGDAARSAEDAAADGGAHHDRQPEGRAEDLDESATLVMVVAHVANITSAGPAGNPLARFLPQVLATIERHFNNGVVTWRHRDIMLPRHHSCLEVRGFLVLGIPAHRSDIPASS